MVSDGWPDGPCERVYAMKFALPEIAERASAICDEARSVANWPGMHDESYRRSFCLLQIRARRNPPELAIFLY